MSDINKACEGRRILSWRNWLKGKASTFGDYNSLLMSYIRRKLTFEADEINAMAGCLNFISEHDGMPFMQGLLAKDFHYALFWQREYDR